MNSYSQLSLEERYTLSSGLANSKTIKEISQLLGRHVSTLYRELKRNLRPSGFYAAFVANSYATARNHRCHRGSQFPREVWDHVEKHIKDEWSPEQISHKLLQDGLCSISTATIYRKILEDRKKGGVLYHHLRIMPKRRRKRYRSEDYRGRLKGKRDISERPQEAQLRTEFGHWEADTVMGEDRSECVLTLVERKIGLGIITKILHRNATEVYYALSKIIRNNKAYFKSITFDNGTEFHGYKKLEKRLKIECYFARPHHPWERGSNENFNGLLRQYLPKGSSMKNIGNITLNKFCQKLNNRPRKRYDYKSPQELLNELLKDSHLLC